MQRMPSPASALLALLVFVPWAGCGPAAPGDAGITVPRSSRIDPDRTPDNRKPVPPLNLVPPAPPEATNDGRDLRRLAAAELLREAREAAGRGEYPLATQLQYWAVQATGTEQYDLACYESRQGRVGVAFYWLQLAAGEDGVDADWAEQDPDLESLRVDPRWGKVSRYLHRFAAYWAASDERLTDLVTPTGYDGRTPLTTLVWLHGSFSHPGVGRSGLVRDVQAFADREQVAIVGVSGSVPLGKAKFNWSEDPERDFRRIAAALDEVTARVKVRRDAVIAVGFSQGAEVGLVVATRHPETFAGAIALSPGSTTGSLLPTSVPTPSLVDRGFVIAWGEEDDSSRVQLASNDVRWLRGAKAKVLERRYPDLGHSLPADIEVRLGEWVRFVIKARTE
jgi:predicted esterase